MDNYILIFGGDPQVMQLRKLVLERAGFKVLFTSEREALRQLAKAKRLALLLLNDSPPRDHVHEALQIARSSNPPVKALVLGYSDTLASSLKEGEQFMETYCGPDALIEKIAEMTGNAYIKRPKQQRNESNN
jgi:CheY-like chemotaxis protein